MFQAHQTGTGRTQMFENTGFFRGYVPPEEAHPSFTRLVIETKERRFINDSRERSAQTWKRRHDQRRNAHLQILTGGQCRPFVNSKNTPIQTNTNLHDRRHDSDFSLHSRKDVRNASTFNYKLQTFRHLDKATQGEQHQARRTSP